MLIWAIKFDNGASVIIFMKLFSDRIQHNNSLRISSLGKSENDKDNFSQFLYTINLKYAYMSIM